MYGAIRNKIIEFIYMDELLVIHLCTYMVAVENPPTVLQESDYHFHAFKEETELQKLEN